MKLLSACFLAALMVFAGPAKAQTRSEFINGLSEATPAPEEVVPFLQEGAPFKTTVYALSRLPRSNAELSALSSTKYPTAVRVGFAAAGDSPPLTFASSGSACSLNGGAGDGGSQVPSADGKCWLAKFPPQIDVRWFGAADGCADCTAAINAAIAVAAALPFQPAQGSRQTVSFPAGTFNVTGVRLPGVSPAGFNGPIIRGQGIGTVINMLPGHATSCVVLIGDAGTVNGTSNVVLIDLQITSTNRQSGGGYICLNAAARPLLENIWMQDGHAYDCVLMNGADFHVFKNVQCYNPSNNGVTAYNGFNCEFARVARTGSVGTVGNATYTLGNTADLFAGMAVWDATRQFPLNGTIQSIVPNTSFTMTGRAAINVAVGDNLVFGKDCGPTGITFRDTLILGAGAKGVLIGGGIGGIYADNLHIYRSNYAFVVNTSLSPIPNREFFFGPNADFDSNINYGLYVANDSLFRLVCTGCWINASSATGAVYIGKQLEQWNGGSGTAAVELGANVQFSNCVVGYSAGHALTWEDRGTLQVNGCNLSYSRGSGSGLYINAGQGAGGGSVVANGNVMNSNPGYGLAAATLPADIVAIGNIWKGNTLGAQSGLVAGAKIACTGNLTGAVSGC